MCSQLDKENGLLGVKIKMENKLLPRVYKTGVWNFGNRKIECAVLKDGTRIFTQTGVSSALNRSTTYSGKEEVSLFDLKVPPFLVALNIRNHLTKELLEECQPIIFVTEKGKRALGYKASCLIDLMWFFVGMLKSGNLSGTNQKENALFYEAFLKAISKGGVISVIDEATGYQYIRDKDALQKILNQYMSENLSSWVKTFPDSFYQHIYRLKGWGKCVGTKRCMAMAQITVDVVYDRLAPQIIDELRDKMPKTETGKSKGKYHQLLSDDVGKNELKNLLIRIEAIQMLAKTWEEFKSMLDIVAPVKSMQAVLIDQESGAVGADSTQV